MILLYGLAVGHALLRQLAIYSSGAIVVSRSFGWATKINVISPDMMEVIATDSVSSITVADSWLV